LAIVRLENLYAKTLNFKRDASTGASTAVIDTKSAIFRANFNIFLNEVGD
jgi:hypothetical protein